MVIVLGGVEKKKLLHTAVVDETSDPKWASEYCLQLPSLDVELEFQVYHHNKIFKNELIGTYSVQLSQVTGLESGVHLNGEMTAKHAPSSTSSSSMQSVGTLSIAMCSYPGKPVPLMSATSIGHQTYWTASPYPSFRLHFERFVYHPGETIKGAILFVSSATAPKKLEGIEISALGKTHFEFRSQQPIGFPSNKEFSTGVHKSSMDFLWFNVRCPVSSKIDFISKIDSLALSIQPCNAIALC